MIAATTRGDPDVPAEQRVDDGGEQVEVDAGDQHLGDGEADRVDQVGGRAEPPEHELRDRRGPWSRSRTASSRRRGTASPGWRRSSSSGTVGMPNCAPLADMPMISTAPRLARDERQPGHPRRQRAAGEEEVDAARDLGPGQEPDAENEDEVDTRPAGSRPSSHPCAGSTTPRLASSTSDSSRGRGARYSRSPSGCGTPKAVPRTGRTMRPDHAPSRHMTTRRARVSGPGAGSSAGATTRHGSP